MHKLIFSTKDTYISNHRFERLTNFGANQTLAIDCTYVHNSVEESTKTTRRTLIKFDLTNVSKSLAEKNINDVKFILNLKASDFFNVPVEYSIYAYPVDKEWQQGKGLYAYDGNVEGVNWVYRNYPDTSSIWYENMSLNSTIGENYFLTESVDSFIRGGGTWLYNCSQDYVSDFYTIYSGSSFLCSQSFNYTTEDIMMDVTNICKAWICNVIPNEGFILMSSTELLPNSTDGGEMQYFSTNTNTIYQPYISVKYDDSSYTSSGGLATVTSSVGVYVSINNLKPSYKAGSIINVNVFARDMYPKKNFNRLQDVYLTPKLLPSRSYYSVVDNDKFETIIPFDEYTKISGNDIRGNYFVLDTTGFQPERYYRILIKTIYEDDTTEVFDNNVVFKLVR